MAMLDIQSGRGRRSLAPELPLVPFIDFLLCIIAFLLVTAVWTEMARLEADALVPAEASARTDRTPRFLHVEPRAGDRFRLTWKQGSTVVAMEDVTSRPVVAPGGVITHPELTNALRRHAKEYGTRRLPRDRAVLHTGNDTPFERVAAWLDAIHEPRRTVVLGARETDAPAFDVAFSID